LGDRIKKGAAVSLTVFGIQLSGASCGLAGEGAALLRACEQGDVVGAQRSLAQGASAQARSRDGQTCLHHAANHGAVVLSWLLIQSPGVDCDARDAAGRSPLHAAARAGHSRVVGLLIGAGCDVHARDRQGRTPLHEAAASGSHAVMDALLDAGADPWADAGVWQLAHQSGSEHVMQRLRQAQSMR
jgi:ankyrin repeat protein